MTQSLTNDQVVARIRESFEDAVLNMEMLYDMLCVTVAKEKSFEFLKWLKEDEVLQFHFLTTLCGMHFPEATEKFGLMVQLHNMPANIRIRIKIFTDEAEPSFQSLTEVWPCANWMEREAYDFFGFRFPGHPNLKRILNMDSLEGWPLRKEYPLEDPFRMDKDDKMFGR